MFDENSNPPSRPAAYLLDELESIKGALTEGPDPDSDLPADIPLLEDMVIEHLDDNAKLLNIEQIFDEDANVAAVTAPAALESLMPFPRFTLDVAISDAGEPPSNIRHATAAKPSVRPDYRREVLIQELVDEFIPQIEAELHRRLQRLDDATLQRLKDSE